MSAPVEKAIKRFKLHPSILLIKSSVKESWRQSLDSAGYSGAVLMDLSNAFDTINHKL